MCVCVCVCVCVFGCVCLAAWALVAAQGFFIALQSLSCPIACGMFSLTRDGSHIPCIGRWILNYWSTREVLAIYIKRDIFKQKHTKPGGMLISELNIVIRGSQKLNSVFPIGSVLQNWLMQLNSLVRGNFRGHKYHE